MTLPQSQPVSSPSAVDQLAQFRADFLAVLEEMRRVIIGQDKALEELLVGVFSGGHILLTGVPGLGRTLLVKTLGKVLGLAYNRIQFTPDLLPSDIIGSEVLEKTAQGQRHFRFFKGPVFCNLLLADEINRSPARTQAALLEAMHERQVTIGGQTYRALSPFVVIATRNSMETEGVWRMPEAQIDRFMVSIELGYPGEADEIELTQRTTGESFVEPQNVLDPGRVVAMQQISTALSAPPAVQELALRIVRLSRPTTPIGQDGGSDKLTHPDVRLGASPRAAQAILRGAKVLAIVRGRCYVSSQDVIDMSYPVLSHRLVLDLRASSRGLTASSVIDRLVEQAQAQRLNLESLGSNAKRILKK